MFIKKLLSWNKGPEVDHQKYDRLTFKINYKQNVPIYYQQSPEIFVDEEQFTPNHVLYYQIFKKQEIQTDEYTVQENDSLTGIALRFNLTGSILRQLNKSISQNIFPNMKLRIPKNCRPASTQPPKQQQVYSTTQLFESQQTEIYHYPVYFLKGEDIFKGTLTIKPNYIIFNPLIDDVENKGVQMEDLVKYNSIIQIRDLKEVGPAIDPLSIQYTQLGADCHSFKLYLYKIGNKSVEQKYKDLLASYKEQDRPLAVVNFKAYDEDPIKQLKIRHQIVEKIFAMLLKHKYEQQQLEQDPTYESLTNVPFYELYVDQNHLEPLDKKQSLQSKKSVASIKLIGDCILPQESFLLLAVNFQSVYKFCNWTNLYSCFRNGSSFNTLLRMCQSKYPLMLIIKEYKGNIFGAYIVESLDTGKTGSGQMFIWKYNTDSKTTEVFKWTQKNHFFVFIDMELGIGIGMGKRYGIYIKNDLMKGHSGPTETFGNQMGLSVHQDFQIDDIEIWGIEEEEV